MSASPQLEDGFTSIANELLEAILAAKLSKRQLVVVLAIIRLTYGWRKKTDDVTVTRIANLAGLTRSHASETLSELEQMKVTVPKRHGRRGYIVGINKDYGTWRGVPKRDTVPKRDAHRPKMARSPSQNGTPYKEKENTKRKPKRNTNGALPDWLDLMTWEAFVEMRKRIRAPLTDYAKSLVLKKLERMRNDGEDPKAILERSIERGWRSVFPLKHDPRQHDGGSIYVPG